MSDMHAPPRPRFSNQISTGNIIQIGVLVVGIAVSYATIQAQVRANSQRIDATAGGLGEETKTRYGQIEGLRSRMRVVEASAAKTGVEFQAIQRSISTIETQLAANNRLLRELIAKSSANPR